MMSTTDLSPEKLETVKVSRLPTTVITANGSINTTQEATVYVKTLDMVVTVQLFEDNKERMVDKSIPPVREEIVAVVEKISQEPISHRICEQSEVIEVTETANQDRNLH